MGSLARTIFAALLMLAIVDVSFRNAFPTLPRFAPDFSGPYLAREMRALVQRRPIVVLGDSALWGYGVSPQRSAVGILHASDARWTDLAFEGGSPANTYAMLRLLRAARVRPQAIVFNANLKEFASADPAYATLAPAVEEDASASLAAAERARLVSSQAQTFDARADRAIGRLWALYGMREDLRAALFGAPDAAHALLRALQSFDGTAARVARAAPLEPERFEGTYDLTPLGPANVSAYFLARAATLAVTFGVPCYAILTPTNHALLHTFIDSPEYEAQLRYERRILEASGVRVLDYDRTFAAADFIDNDHLTEAGNAALAERLAADVRT
jgi:lysophospholipase L1-like esterase